MDQTRDLYGMYDGTRRELVAAELEHDVGLSISLFDAVHCYLWRRSPHVSAGSTIISMHTSTMPWGIYDGMGYEISLVCTTRVCAQSMPLERGANRGLCRTHSTYGLLS
jgi:hypothetical protein